MNGVVAMVDHVVLLSLYLLQLLVLVFVLVLLLEGLLMLMLLWLLVLMVNQLVEVAGSCGKHAGWVLG